MSQNNNLHKWERLIALVLACVVIITLIVYVFFLPEKTDSPTIGLIRFFAALVAGLSAYLFAGNLDIEGKVPFGKLGVRASGSFAAFLVILLLFYWGIPTLSTEDSQEPKDDHTEIDISQNMSMGGRLLNSSVTSKDKREGLEAFSSDEFSNAVGSFETSLKEAHNDPETLIYLNNAEAELEGQTSGVESLRIAVSVPISGERGVAESILRGVAQAQNEVNSTQEGIDGRKLQVLLADDEGDETIAVGLAEKFIEDTSVLAVVGGFSSSLAKRTADVYDDNLVFISPTATSVDLSNYNSYFFRIPPSDAIAAQQLSEYANDKFGVDDVAIAYDFRNPYSESLKKEFENFFGREAIHTCDLGGDGFDATRSCIKPASEADAFLLIPAIQTSLDKALALINSLDSRFKLLGGDSMYSQKTTRDYGQKAMEGELTIALPWHRFGCNAVGKSDFEANSCELWKQDDINWRTATAYDAVRVLISALDDLGSSPDRRKLQRQISDSNFSTEGATGTIEFETTGNLRGDRKTMESTAVLVKVQPVGEKYDFLPVN